jgi:ubiquinone/menaquinone biosynthesis C-methylase UbiE
MKNTLRSIVGSVLGKRQESGPPVPDQGATAASSVPETAAEPASHEKSEEYWTRHNVTLHRVFQSVEESLSFIEWRNLQHPYYIEFMPVTGFDGKVVLDYGCGPGHDLVGFATESKPARLIGMDVSCTSLAESELRMRLHRVKAEFSQIAENDPRIPLPDASVDVIHSSGVLHHTPDPERILGEFRRVLKPTGHAQIMVYNYDSLWMHLYVAYQLMLVEGRSSGKSLRQAFTASTDGPDCPISECYTPQEFLAMAGRAGLGGRLHGVAMSAWEMKLFPQRWDALLDKRLPSMSRKFLYELTLNERGIPCYRGNVAGVDACFEVRRV